MDENYVALLPHFLEWVQGRLPSQKDKELRLTYGTNWKEWTAYKEGIRSTPEEFARRIRKSERGKESITLLQENLHMWSSGFM